MPSAPMSRRIAVRPGPSENRSFSPAMASSAVRDGEPSSAETASTYPRATAIRYDWSVDVRAPS